MTDITIRPARADEAATLAAIEAAGFPPAEAASPESIRERLLSSPNNSSSPKQTAKRSALLTAASPTFPTCPTPTTTTLPCTNPMAHTLPSSASSSCPNTVARASPANCCNTTSPPCRHAANAVSSSPARNSSLPGTNATALPTTALLIPATAAPRGTT